METTDLSSQACSLNLCDLMHLITLLQVSVSLSAEVSCCPIVTTDV